MRELHEKFLEHLEEINDAIHNIKPPYPGFMYDDLRNALPEGDQILGVLQSHLTGEIESIQSALGKINLISAAFGRLSELHETSSGELSHLINEHKSRREEKLYQLRLWVDKLSLSEDDKAQIKEWVFSIEADLNYEESKFDLFFELDKQNAISITRNAIND